MTDIFISYSRSDRARVEPIADLLKESGFDVWFDARLEAGESFSAEIDRHLNAAGAVLLVASKASMSSKWVEAEALYGWEQRKLVACRIDGTALKTPFNAVHVEDVSDCSGDLTDPVWPKLIDRLKSVIDGSGKTIDAHLRAAGAEENVRLLLRKPVLKLSSTPIRRHEIKLELEAQISSGQCFDYTPPSHDWFIELITMGRRNRKQLVRPDNGYATTSLAWSPNGDLIVTAGDGFLCKAWRLRGGFAATGSCADGDFNAWLSSMDRVYAVEATNSESVLAFSHSGVHLMDTFINERIHSWPWQGVGLEGEHWPAFQPGQSFFALIETSPGDLSLLGIGGGLRVNVDETYVEKYLRGRAPGFPKPYKQRAGDRTFKCHSHAIHSFAWHPKGRFFATSSIDGLGHKLINGIHNFGER